MTIDYTYDPLYRLTSADYSTGDFYHYAYDSVGNRLTQDSTVNSLPSTVNYQYDDANRLASVDGVNYTFDANGNLLNDGQNEYVYDSANRLTSVSGTTSYTYNGLGDRYQQTVNSQTTTYILDLNAGLTQVLDDGENAYLYGLGRIAQVNTSTEYFMGDALGSVRQLVEGGDIVLAKSYAPYGEDLYSNGSGESAFAYTGEQTDPNGLVYLRARYYGPSDGRLLSRDSWDGDVNDPITLNRWVYVNDNPINYTDPSGNLACKDVTSSAREIFEKLHLCDPNEEPTLSPESVDKWEKWPLPNLTPCVLVMTINGPQCIAQETEDEGACPGIIIIPAQKNEKPRDGYCKSLEQSYFNILRELGVLTRQILALQKELADTKEPERREDLLKEIFELINQVEDLLKEVDRIYNYAKNIGCNVIGWP